MNNFIVYFKNLGTSIVTKCIEVFNIFKKKGVALFFNLFCMLFSLLVVGYLVLFSINLNVQNIFLMCIGFILVFLISIVFNANTYYILESKTSKFKLFIEKFKKDFLSIILNQGFLLFLVFILGFSLYFLGQSALVLNTSSIISQINTFQTIGFWLLGILGLFGVGFFFMYLIVNIFVFIDIYVKNSSINKSFERVVKGLKNKYLFVFLHVLPFLLVSSLIEDVFGNESFVNIIFSLFLVLFIPAYLYLIYLDIIKKD
jgi:hypothetical protein